jgi:hypothetical protein
MLPSELASSAQQVKTQSITDAMYRIRWIIALEQIEECASRNPAIPNV